MGNGVLKTKILDYDYSFWGAALTVLKPLIHTQLLWKIKVLQYSEQLSCSYQHMMDVPIMGGTNALFHTCNRIPMATFLVCIQMTLFFFCQESFLFLHSI